MIIRTVILEDNDGYVIVDAFYTPDEEPQIEIINAENQFGEDVQLTEDQKKIAHEQFWDLIQIYER